MNPIFRNALLSVAGLAMLFVIVTTVLWVGKASAEDSAPTPKPFVYNANQDRIDQLNGVKPRPVAPKEAKEVTKVNHGAMVQELISLAASAYTLGDGLRAGGTLQLLVQVEGVDDTLVTTAVGAAPAPSHDVAIDLAPGVQTPISDEERDRRANALAELPPGLPRSVVLRTREIYDAMVAAEGNKPWAVTIVTTAEVGHMPAGTFNIIGGNNSVVFIFHNRK